MHNMLASCTKYLLRCMVTIDLAGKEGTQASTPIGANLLLAYGSTGSPKLNHLIGQPTRDCRPSAMQFIIIMLMTMMVIMLLSRGGVMGGWQNESFSWLSSRQNGFNRVSDGEGAHAP